MGYMRQVLVAEVVEPGPSPQTRALEVCWLPEERAVKGKILEIFKGKWEVLVVYKDVRLPVEYVRERSRDYKHTRDASDI